MKKVKTFYILKFILLHSASNRKKITLFLKLLIQIHSSENSIKISSVVFE